MIFLNKRFAKTRSLLVILIALVQISCQRPYAKNDQGVSADFSSRLPVTSTEESAGKDTALCNKIQSSLLTAQLMVFYDKTNTYHPEFIRLYFPQLDASLADNKYQIVLRKWKANLQGETYQEDVPLKLRAEKLSDRTPLNGYMNAFHWNTVASEIQKYSPSTTYTFAESLEQISYVVDLKDFDLSYDVLKLSLYDNGKWLKDWNMLIPAFYAHPLTYAENQNQVLAQLHPFYGSESSSFDASHFADVLNGYCF